MSRAKERVYKAIKEGSTTEIIKGELLIEDKVICAWKQKEKVDFAAKQEFVTWLGLDIITIVPDYHNLVDDPEIPEIEHWAKTDLFVFVLIDGPFELGLKYLGFDEFFSLLRKNSKELLEWVENIEKINQKIIRKVSNLGVNGIILADDIAYKQSLYISPQQLQEYFFPSYYRIVNEIKKEGLVAFFHSDGNYRKILEELINIGFEGIHCLDKNSGMDIYELKKELQKDICFWGHLTYEDLIRAYTKNDLEEIIASIKKIASEGRFILGTTTGLYPGLDLRGLALIYQNV
ncbi:uroporphyrinogen decarboxylase family protein [Carboxydothermus ferrireducens]|uniref:Uroporphyrinogen decarboxylase n=1 Tax=Carboxydothermus ferrireducens DSM 11255 TaxID=1119529 RepID=A0ABX2RBB5_9THEO|nr:uroporphyrinogen decarboxylase family protein [Carboxydothermus ferrireducens]NYE58474.1 uroporphyrinogen decarboxylase [Carboxydothermus ferrireducens DSM 11255]